MNMVAFFLRIQVKCLKDNIVHFQFNKAILVQCVHKTGSGFNFQPGRGFKLRRPSFATPSVDRNVKPLVLSLSVLSGDSKEPAQLSLRVSLVPLMC